MIGTVLAIYAIGFQATKSKPVQTVTLKTDNDRIAYVLGVQMARNLGAGADKMDAKILLQGFMDARAKGKMLMSETDLAAGVQKALDLIRRNLRFGQLMSAEDNRAEATKFLAENKKRPGVKTTESGLQYKVLQPGSGPRPTDVSAVVVNFTGTLLDGTVFDSSEKHGGGPTTFTVAKAIPGFREGLKLMSVGSKFKFFMPAHLAYGKYGAPNVGLDKLLVFEIELVAIK